MCLRECACACEWVRGPRLKASRPTARLSQTHSLHLSLSLSHAHTHTLSLSHSLSRTHTNTHTHTHTLSLSLTLTHAHTHTHSHTHAHAIMSSRFCFTLMFTCDRLRVGWLNGFLWVMIDSGRGTKRAEDAQGTPGQSHISPSILLYEDKTINKKSTLIKAWTGVNQRQITAARERERESGRG